MKLWAGRFEKQTDSLVEDFHSSISFDSRLYRHDLLGSIAHAKMLASCHIITAQEGNVLIEGLKSILAAIESGEVEISTTAEDIHTNMEALLIERVGEVGKKLHTARSRNDQVSLDTRMFLKAEIEIISSQLLALEQQLLQLASQHLNTVMPGYTHLQKAQPITLAHHFMAYFQMFRRDIERLQDCYKRVDVLPLGSGALAGTTFPIDRQMVATELGFSSLSENSLDAVSDRDFIIEFIAAASILMMHLSRFCEELILWSSDEFKFVEMDDAYSTGSSIMPQKKNPDVAELIRGKTGRVYGDLIAVLSMMKSLPLAYNKDMQEDKEALFDAVDTVKKCLMLFTPMIITMKINAETMRKGAESGFANATDVADYLAKKGVAFRNAHEIVGHLVLYCIKHKKDLSSLSLAEYKQFCPDFDEDIFAVISIDTCVDRRCVYGGPAALAVRHSIDRGRAWLNK